MLSKQRLRVRMLNKLKNQKEEEALSKSLIIKVKLFKLSMFKRAKTVMFYLSKKGEVQTRQMINEAVNLGKRIVVPTLDKKARRIMPCLLQGLEPKYIKKGPYNIDEPVCKKPVNTGKIDLFIVPGVAFDKKGRRLGRGKGCYDRFFSNTLCKDIPKIGLAFKFQVFERLCNCLPHDARVDKVIYA